MPAISYRPLEFSLLGGVIVTLSLATGSSAENTDYLDDLLVLAEYSEPRVGTSLEEAYHAPFQFVEPVLREPEPVLFDFRIPRDVPGYDFQPLLNLDPGLVFERPKELPVDEELLLDKNAEPPIARFDLGIVDAYEQTFGADQLQVNPFIPEVNELSRSRSARLAARPSFDQRCGPGDKEDYWAVVIDSDFGSSLSDLGQCWLKAYENACSFGYFSKATNVSCLEQDYFHQDYFR